MNKNISTLIRIAEKKTRLVIGLMSGTSLDGLDVALCEITGNGSETKLVLKEFLTINYEEDFKQEVRSIFSKSNIDLQKLCVLNAWIGSSHAAMVNKCLEKWEIKNNQIDLIASHGQTIFHAPKIAHRMQKFGNATLQIGDGDHIAVGTGIITISDFRQKHIAAGGEGAPLAVYGDHILFSKPGEDRILLNIGGIANFTWLPGSGNIGDIFCTDVGPGNTMMDSFVQQNFPGKYYDENAQLAKEGNVNEMLLQALKENDFFLMPFPKTTGPELFNLGYLQSAKEKSETTFLNIPDTLRTITMFTAVIITEAIQKCIGHKKEIRVFMSGGGTHNPLIVQELRLQLKNCSFHSTAELEIDPDAKEAVLFAVLANECLCGDPSVFRSSGNGLPAISMGKISLPL